MPARKSACFILSLAVLALPALHGTAFGAGACCSVARPGSERMSLTVVGASAKSHETIGGDTYELSQQALLLKFGKPIGRGFILQALIGLPTATELSRQEIKLSGNGGLILGVGLGYKLPRFLDPVDFFAAISHSHSHGYLDRGETGAVGQTFRIAELQALFIGETALTSKTALYAGLRAYSGKNRLENNKTGNKLNGDQEGSLAGLAGIRYSVSDKFSLVADAGFGHTRVLGIGVVFSF